MTEESSERTPVTAKTRHGELTIDQLAEIQPGMARLMDELSDRVWYLYYAAEGGNWELARHELNETRSLLKVMATVRPKYAQDLATFVRENLDPMQGSIESQDWDDFENKFAAAMKAGDDYHDKYGYYYIKFVLPANRPEHLKLKKIDKPKQ